MNVRTNASSGISTSVTPEDAVDCDSHYHNPGRSKDPTKKVAYTKRRVITPALSPWNSKPIEKPLHLIAHWITCPCCTHSLRASVLLHPSQDEAIQGTILTSRTSITSGWRHWLVYSHPSVSIGQLAGKQPSPPLFAMHTWTKRNVSR